MTVRLPEIGDLITTEWGLELCRHYGLDYLVERITAHPDLFEPWEFDGVSCVPDTVMGIFVGKGHAWRDVTWKCALPHDLGYAYGEPGNEMERAKLDHDFRVALEVHAGMEPEMARIFERMVKTFGKEKYGHSYSFCFARRKKCQASM